MAPRLPVTTPVEVIAALKRMGFRVVRQHGGHVFLRHELRPGKYVCVPSHRGDLSSGTLMSILRQAGVTVDQLREVL